jgi:hypothetical protein
VDYLVVRGGPQAESGRGYQYSFTRCERIDTYEFLGLADPKHLFLRAKFSE